MSDSLLSAQRAIKSSYLQTTVDDMDSFFWVALWASLLHPSKDWQATSEIGIDWGQSVKGERATVLAQLLSITRSALENDPLLKVIVPLIREWNRRRQDLRDEWYEHQDDAMKEGQHILLPGLFRLYATSSVLQFLEVLNKHFERIKGSS